MGKKLPGHRQGAGHRASHDSAGDCLGSYPDSHPCFGIPRSSILSTVSEDYMKTAQAKGLTKKQAILRHGMRNARVSIITVLCNRLPDLLSGALIVETIFCVAWNWSAELSGNF